MPWFFSGEVAAWLQSWTVWRGRWMAHLEEGTGIHCYFTTLRPTHNPNRYLKYLRRIYAINRFTGESDSYFGNLCGFDFPPFKHRGENADEGYGRKNPVVIQRQQGNL